MDFQGHSVLCNYNCTLPRSALKSDKLHSGNCSLSWPPPWYIDFTDTLTKYDVAPDQISVVIHDEVANAVLAGKLTLTLKFNTVYSFESFIINMLE